MKNFRGQGSLGEGGGVWEEGFLPKFFMLCPFFLVPDQCNMPLVAQFPERIF